MKIAISAESTIDISKELKEKYDISVIPFTIIMGNKEIKDGTFITEKLFHEVDKTGVFPKTTALNQFEYVEYFKCLREKYDAVIHIALSSGITSTVDHAICASNEVAGVYVVDSLSLSSGIGLLCIYARRLAESGLSPNEIVEKTQNRAKSLVTSFVIERLDYLYKGGRCNGFQLLGANILKIRPRILMKDGKMTNEKKYRGQMPIVVSNFVKDLLNEFNKPDLNDVFIAYTTITEEMLNAIILTLKNIGFKNIYTNYAGGTVACHCGENTVGIFYFNDEGVDN